MGAISSDKIFKLSNRFINDLELKKEILKLYPGQPWEDIANTIGNISKLKKKAYEMADKHRQKLVSKKESIQTLKETCPGFLNATYNEAWDKGMFESIW